MIDVSATSKHDQLTAQHSQYQHTPPPRPHLPQQLGRHAKVRFFFQSPHFFLKKLRLLMKNSFPIPSSRTFNQQFLHGCIAGGGECDEVDSLWQVGYGQFDQPCLWPYDLLPAHPVRGRPPPSVCLRPARRREAHSLRCPMRDWASGLKPASPSSAASMASRLTKMAVSVVSCVTTTRRGFVVSPSAHRRNPQRVHGRTVSVAVSPS